MDMRAINADMVKRTLEAPVQTLADGEYGLRVIETTGSRTGHRRRVPLAVVNRHGRWYLVAPGRDRDWVNNLLAEPACTVVSAAGDRVCVAVPVAGTDAAAVVSQYLKSMSVPWAIRAFPVSQGATLDDIAASLDEMAVFELCETDGAK